MTTPRRRRSPDSPPRLTRDAYRMRAKRDRDRVGLSPNWVDVDEALAVDGLIAVGLLSEPEDDSSATAKGFRRALSVFLNDALRRAAKK
jgi:hypothetical protein